jgi:pimeloyl-ACP methyl ester carboxylesterase
MTQSDLKFLRHSRAAVWAGAALLGSALTAAWVERHARRAERNHPGTGLLLEIDGVRLHVVEKGEGPEVVLIHGNMVSERDYKASGLLDRLSRNHRVIAFDRPGFGHSTRPRDRLWTPAAQAKLLHAALAQLGVKQAVVVGHSMGAMVALALALDYPEDVRRLVLLGGYYYPSARIDALLTAPVAVPVLGDVMRYTVTAISARLMLNRLVQAMFAPRKVPGHFIPTLSREMMVRPIQLRANAEDAAFMVAQAKASSERHHELRMPVAIVAGADDEVIDVEAHSARLHRELASSTLAVVPGVGHMVHHAAPDDVVAAVDGFEMPRLEPIKQAAECQRISSVQA